MQKVGIIGYGIIGQAVAKLFTGKAQLCIYDSNPRTIFNTEEHKKSINNCNIAFICVPTPHNQYDGLDMSIVERVVKELNPGIFVCCSALQPGTADNLTKEYRKKIVVQPEYFGETTNHPLTNLSQSPFLILGGENKDVGEVIRLYQKVYNASVRIRKVTALEAEVIKLSENRAIAYKVAQCQELYDVCQKSGVDYETIRQAVYGDDPRFNLWWTFVYDDNRGLNSKCIPKDVYGWHKWAEDAGINPELTGSLLEYNNTLIKKDK